MSDLPIPSPYTEHVRHGRINARSIYESADEIAWSDLAAVFDMEGDHDRVQRDICWSCWGLTFVAGGGIWIWLAWIAGLV